MFIYNLSIFLTSTAFVDTNAKCGISLSRYAVFWKTCPLEYNSMVPSFLFWVELYSFYHPLNRRNLFLCLLGGQG